MFNAITFTTLFLICFKSKAFIPIDSAISITSSFSGGLGAGIDLLETSEDLLNEVSDENSDLGQFSKDIKSFDHDLNQYASDLRALGYSEEDISNQLTRIGSNKNNLVQKMKALSKSVKNVKKMKNMLSKLSSIASAAKGGGGGAPDPSNQAILATQQQALHLQIQKMKSDEIKDFEEKARHIVFLKSASDEIENSRNDLVKKIQMQNKVKLSNQSESFPLSVIQKRSIQISMALIVLGCVGLLISFFRSEGIQTIKVGLLGVVLSLLLPSIVNLYQRWLGI